MVTHPRADLDFYIEPEWCTEALLQLPTFSLVEAIYDPCAGSGNVLRAARREGIQAVGSDISSRTLPVENRDQIWKGRFEHLVAFNLCERLGRNTHHAIAVVSNPPYGGGDIAEAFIRHFVSMRGPIVVAVFVQSRFLHSGKRHKLHAIDHRPSIVAHLSDRPSCPPGDALLAGEIEAKGGSQDYCWLIYDKRGWDVSTRTVWLRKPAAKIDEKIDQGAVA